MYTGGVGVRALPIHAKASKNIWTWDGIVNCRKPQVVQVLVHVKVIVVITL